jgi:hypothetical protein
MCLPKRLHFYFRCGFGSSPVYKVPTSNGSSSFLFILTSFLAFPKGLVRPTDGVRPCSPLLSKTVHRDLYVLDLIPLLLSKSKTGQMECMVWGARLRLSKTKQIGSVHDLGLAPVRFKTKIIHEHEWWFWPSGIKNKGITIAKMIFVCPKDGLFYSHVCTGSSSALI